MALLSTTVTRPRRPRLRRLWPVLAVVALVAPRALADHGEYVVKAAFLVNFAKLVEWPANTFSSPTAPIEVAVLGGDPHLAQMVETIDGKGVGLRTLSSRRIDSVSDAVGFHLVFVSEKSNTRTRDLLAATAGGNVLLVGEREDFAQSGGSINFFLEGGKVRFEINPDAAERAGLKLSSRLMRLAVIVQGAAE